MDAFFEAVLNGWWQGMVLTLLVWLVLRDLPRVSAATRLAIWQVTLAVVVLLPALQQVPWPEWPAAGEPAPVSRPAARTMTIAPPAAEQARPGEESRTAPAPAARPLIELSAQDWLPALMLLAGFGALSQLLRLALGYAALWRLKRTAQASGWSAPAGLGRPVRVLLSERIGMPMAVGYRTPAILLPRAMAEALTEDEMRQVLLHETAHLLRRDDWMTLAERVIRAVFFFQPAVHWIGRQLERERELACDDWVVARADSAQPYARALARVAELGNAGRAPLLATGAGKPKEIFRRLEAMLDRTRNRMPVVSEPLVAIAAVALVLAAVQATPFSHLLGLGGYSNRWVESDGANRREWRMRGDVRFTADDRDVERMSPGAKLYIEQTDGWHSRVLEFEADAEGRVARRFFSDGIARSWEGEGQRFAAKMLPQWARERGGQIGERTARLLETRGAEGALEEIRQIRSDSVKRQYLLELLEQARTLRPVEEDRVLKYAGEMNSDGEKRQFLETTRDRFLVTGREAAVLSYIDGLNSDDDRRRLLAIVIEQGGGGARLLRSVGRLQSDGAKGELLRQVAQAANTRLPEAFFQVVNTLHSDDERGRVLATVLAGFGKHPEMAAEALRAAGGLHSDGEKARLVVKAAQDGLPGGAAHEATRVVGTMQSDGARRRALEAILDAEGQTAETLREALLETARINSDGDKAAVLDRVAPRAAGEEPVRRAFFGAVNSIHSSGDQRRVLLAVLRRPQLDAATLREVALSAAQMTSDGDRRAVTQVLTDRQ